MSANRLKLNADKTAFLWTNSKQALRGLCENGQSLLLGGDNIEAASSVRRPGVWVIYSLPACVDG